MDARRRTGRLRAVGVPRPDRRRGSGRHGRVEGRADHGTGHRRHLRGAGWRVGGAPPAGATSDGARAFAEDVPAGRRCASTSDAVPVATPRTWGAGHRSRRRPGHARAVPGRRPRLVRSSKADLEALPFGPAHGARRLGAHELPPRARAPACPGALADLHRTLVVGASVEIQVLAGDYEGDALPADRIGGRFFAGVDTRAAVGRARRRRIRRRRTSPWTVTTYGPRRSRARTLPDIVGPGMRLLVVGLNPEPLRRRRRRGIRPAREPLLAGGASAPGS